MHTNTNNVNKILALLQRTGGKDKPNTVLCGNRNGHHNAELERKCTQHTKIKR